MRTDCGRLGGRLGLGPSRPPCRACDTIGHRLPRTNNAILGGSSRVSPFGEENSCQSAFDEPHQTRKARKSPHQIEFPRTRASPNGLLREPPPPPPRQTDIGRVLITPRSQWFVKTLLSFRHAEQQDACRYQRTWNSAPTPSLARKRVRRASISWARFSTWLMLPGSTAGWCASSATVRTPDSMNACRYARRSSSM